MSALSLTSSMQCQPRNCGSILQVSKTFINHFSEVSNGTLGTTQRPFQCLPAGSPPARPNCEADDSCSASVQARHESSNKCIPTKAFTVCKATFLPLTFYTVILLVEV